MSSLALVNAPHDVPKDLDEAPAEALIAWAAETFGERLVLATSFGADSAALLHLATRIAPNVHVVFVDTGYHFAETYRHADALTARLRLNLHVTTPRMSAARQEALYGKRWEGDDEDLRRYLHMNKVEPMDRALAELRAEAWMSGVRRDQTETRRVLPRIDASVQPTKLHPLLAWTQADVDDYMRTHDLPYHPLVKEGYRSIGDAHSTLPTVPGQHPRDGRLLGAKRECGLHLRRP